MADLSIQYDEEMVGAGHPTKEDTLNRLVLAEHNSDGTHKNGVAAYIVGCGVYPAGVSSLTIRSGRVSIAGADYEIPATLTKSGLTGLDSDSLYRVEVSAPASGSEITASEIAVTTSAHAWNQSRHCLMRSEARLLGLFATDGGGDIIPHYLDGRFLEFDDPPVIADVSSAQTWPTTAAAFAPSEWDCLMELLASLSGTNTYDLEVKVGRGNTAREFKVHNYYSAQNWGGEYPLSAMSAAGNLRYGFSANAGSAGLSIKQAGLWLPPGLGR